MSDQIDDLCSFCHTKHGSHDPHRPISGPLTDDQVHYLLIRLYALQIRLQAITDQFYNLYRAFDAGVKPHDLPVKVTVTEEHHENCDVLEPGPQLGPSSKPCNCASVKQPTKARKTSRTTSVGGEEDDDE